MNSDFGLPEEQMLRPGEKIDDLQRSGLRIIQDPARFCFGMDAVLLTGFIQEGIGGRSVAREQLIDLGTGTGIIPLLMSAKSDCNILTGLEIQPDSAEMASRSVRLNGLEERVRIMQGDIKEADALFAPASFGVITCNPPYMIKSHGLQNPDSPKAIARHEVLCSFEDVTRVTERLLKPGGHFYLVHRPFRLAEIITTLVKYKLEPKRMRLVYPYADREPNMVLLEAVRGGKPRMSVEKPLIIFRAPGEYTEELKQDYGF
jgi:tRNA1Val (adenine37-N6)-methyltransferase